MEKVMVFLMEISKGQWLHSVYIKLGLKTVGGSTKALNTDIVKFYFFFSIYAGIEAM